MRKNLKITVAAAAIAGAAMLLGAPAQAQGFSIGVGPGGGINFSVSTGGYCDEYGCPDAFWDYPVYYCPVYFRGDWYRGPVYFRNQDGDVRFWVRGGWHHDQWDGPRPDWACTDRFGPALGFEYYDNHGFRMSDEWRHRWHHDHPGGYGPGGPGWGLGGPGPGWGHGGGGPGGPGGSHWGQGSGPGGPVVHVPPGGLHLHPVITPPTGNGPVVHVPPGGLHLHPVITPPTGNGPVVHVPPGGLHLQPVNPPLKPIKPIKPLKPLPHPGDRKSVV